MAKPKSILVLSGGLDSTVAAYVAAETTQPILAVSFDYGQKANRRELAAAYSVASSLQVQHRTVFLPFFRELTQGEGALMDPQAAVPDVAREGLDCAEITDASKKAVWVPNRNGIFVAIAAGWAEARGADVLVVGFNAEEARSFPDNSEDFVQRQNEALAFSTANKVRVEAPTGSWSKADIVGHAMKKDWPLELVWSCYDGDNEPCDRCESCQRFDRAIEVAAAGEWLERRRAASKNRD